MAMSGYMSLSDRVRGRKRNHIADSGTPKEVPYPVLRFRAESDESHNRLGKIGVEGRPQWRRCDFSSSMLKRSRQGQGSRAVPRRYAGRQREGGRDRGKVAGHPHRPVGWRSMSGEVQCAASGPGSL